MNKKIWMVITLLAITITACTQPVTQPDIQSTISAGIDQTQTAQELVEPTSSPTNASTNTPIPTKEPTAINTETPEPTKTPEQDEILAIAKNWVATYEENGIKIEVVRILISDKDEKSMNDFSKEENYADKITHVEYVFRITNNTEKPASLYYYSIIASVNGEQTSFSDFSNTMLEGDNLSNDILPGSTLIGGTWVGIKRTAWNEVNTILISIPGIRDSDYEKITKDILLTIEVKDWTFEPFPDELR